MIETYTKVVTLENGTQFFVIVKLEKGVRTPFIQVNLRDINDKSIDLFCAVYNTETVDKTVEYYKYLNDLQLCVKDTIQMYITETWLEMIKDGSHAEAINKFQHWSGSISKEARMAIHVTKDKVEKVYYEPSCKFNHVDCINDPSYILAIYPHWKMDIRERFACDYCINGDAYEDENEK